MNGDEQHTTLPRSESPTCAQGPAPVGSSAGEARVAARGFSERQPELPRHTWQRLPAALECGESRSGTAVPGTQAPGRSGSRAGRGGGRPLCRQAAVTPRPVHGLGGRRDFLLVLTFSGHELSPLRARKSIFYEIIPLEVKRRSTISPGRRKETCLHGY